MPESNKEKQTVPYPRPEKDMDTLMLTGCFGFVFISILCYLSSIWPYFLWLESYRYETLVLCSLAGLLPTALMGAIGSRKFGIPGAAGFVASAMTTAVFLYIRITEVFVGADAQRSPVPNYPRFLCFLMPTVWILFSVLVALVFMKPGEIPEKEE